MNWYKITWNAGFGESYEFIRAESFDEASLAASEAWQEEAESSAEYAAEELTRDEVINYGENPEDYGFEPLGEDE